MVTQGNLIAALRFTLQIAYPQRNLQKKKEQVKKPPERQMCERLRVVDHKEREDRVG